MYSSGWAPTSPEVQIVGECHPAKGSSLQPSDRRRFRTLLEGANDLPAIGKVVILKLFEDGRGGDLTVTERRTCMRILASLGNWGYGSLAASSRKKEKAGYHPVIKCLLDNMLFCTVTEGDFKCIVTNTKVAGGGRLHSKAICRDG